MTFLTVPENRETLQTFYDKIRPMGKGWRRVVTVDPAATDEGSLTAAFLAWFLGCTLVYGSLFATGFLLYGRTWPAALSLVVAVSAAVWLFRVLPRIGFAD